MYVTLISDASFCPQTNSAGFGSWVVSNRARKSYGSMIRDANNSGVAEAMGICNALAYAIRDGNIRKGDYVLIQCDATDGIAIVEGTSVDKPERVKVRTWFRDTVQELKLTIEFRHVKGHSKQDGNKFKAQNKCDALAYSFMCKMRGIKKLRKLKEKIRRSKQNILEVEKLQIQNEIAMVTVKIDRMLAGDY